MLRVFNAQKESPLKGDFIELIKDDFKAINEKYDEDFIRKMSKNKFKKYVKTKIINTAFKFLLSRKEELKKIKTIQYKKFKLQKYLKSNFFFDYHVEILSKLRSRNIDVKSNYKTKFTKNNVENLECSIVGCFDIEDQQHLLKCKPILQRFHKMQNFKNVSYEDIFSNVQKQKKITDLYINLLDTRKKILEEQKSN